MTHYLYQEQNWQAQLSDLITDPLELLNILELSPEQLLSGALLASIQFKLRVPRAFVTRMQKGNPLDPLLLQVLPHHLELEEHPDFVTDPLGEEQANQQPGVLHKYKTRFLLTLTGHVLFIVVTVFADISPIKRTCQSQKIGSIFNTIFSRNLTLMKSF